MLIPATPLLTKVRKAWESDPLGTSALIDEAVATWMLDELDRYAEPLSKCFTAQSVESVRLAKRALGRRYVEEISKGVYPDDVEMQRTAQWLSDLEVVVSKISEETKEKKRRNVEQQGRQAGGRFGFKIDTKSESDVRGTHPTQLSPHAEGLVVTDETGQIKINDQLAGTEGEHQVNRHQSQWEQVNDGIRSMAADMGRDAGKVNFVVTIDGSQGLYKVTGNLGQASAGLKDLGEKFNAQSDTIKAVELSAPVDASPELTQKVNIYNQVGYAAAGSVPSWLRRLSSSDWQGLVGPGDPQASGLNRMFDRVTAGSSVLRALPGVDDKYAEWARFVGTVGPEADRALGPHIRRAAYRYRGTEKTPDAELRADLSTTQGSAYAGVIALADNEVPSREVTAIGDRMPSDGNPVVTSMINRARKGAQGDQLRMQVASDVAVGDMLRYLPEDPFTAKLSEKSGHVLPSHGVLFNAKGEIVSQSVGSADDHYLPFDLKNLGALRGGQYVRTRTAGGLTGEDVYTAIQSGARMVTVASSSGVFTMEMDPAFRGARGNSDKAREMYTRYLQILDAVEASGLYLQDVPGPMKAKLRAEAAASVIPTGDKKADEKAIGDAYERRLEAMRRDQSALDADELERIQSEAEDEVLNNPQTKRMSNPQIRRTIDDVYEDKVEAARADKVQALRLNAAGYDMALKTLQQQYPYFIRSVSHTSLKDLGGTARLRANESGEDRGYVRPGGLKPDKVRSGYYNAVPAGQAGQLPGPKRERETTEPGGETRAAGASSGAPGGAAKPGAGAASPAAPAGASRLGQALQVNATLAQASGKNALASLSNGLANFNPPVTLSYDGEFNPEGTPTQHAAWALRQLTLSPSADVLSKPGVLEALNDPSAVKAGFKAVWGTPAVGDLTDSEGSAINPEEIGGATTADQLHAWVSQQARLAVDSITFAQPFAGPAPEDPAMLFDAPAKPYSYTDLDRVSEQELEGFTASGDGQRLQALAAERGWIKSNGDYESAPMVARDVKDSLEVLRAIREATKNVAHSQQMQNAPHENSALDMVVAAIPANGKIKPAERIERALGRPLAQSDLMGNETTLEARAADLHRAWSLLTTERAVGTLTPDKEGGGFPKEKLLRRTPSPQEDVKKAQAEPDLDDPVVVARLLASVGIR